MEIILKEDVVNLGYKNDIVNVKSGYGRNYLIPTGKAVIASPSAKKMLAEELKQRAHKLEKIKKDAEAMAAKLEGVSLTIATKVSSTGTIFGSVGNIQIAEALSKLGHEVDRKIIVVKDAVKEVGSYKAIVKLHKEVSVEIPFEVVAEVRANLLHIQKAICSEWMNRFFCYLCYYYYEIQLLFSEEEVFASADCFGNWQCSLCE